MAVFNWDDKFDVGIEEINNEHKHLLTLINGLFDAMSKGQSKKIIDGLLIELAEYGINHFANEERYFKRYNYPSAKAHIEAHEAFKQTVNDLIESQKTGNNVSLKTLHFVREWVSNHILEMDQAYATFLQEAISK